MNKDIYKQNIATLRNKYPAWASIRKVKRIKRKT